MSTKTDTTNGDVSSKKLIKTIVLASTGSGSDYSNLQIKEEEYPKIERDDQCIVRIKAAGLNFAELMQRQGLYRPATKTPYTPGYEGSSSPSSSFSVLFCLLISFIYAMQLKRRRNCGGSWRRCHRVRQERSSDRVQWQLDLERGRLATQEQSY